MLRFLAIPLAFVLLGCDGQSSSADPSGSESRAAEQIAAGPSADQNPIKVEVHLNRAPVVQNMTASRSPLEVNVEVSLHAVASDADGDALTYEWSTACNGSFTGDGLSPRFILQRQPSSGSCTFHVTVRDGTGGDGEGDLTLPVGSIVATTAGNPSIGIVFQSDDSIEPGQMMTLGTEAIGGGGGLTYDWSATDGTFAGQQDSQPQGTIPGRSTINWTAPAHVDRVWDVTVVVRDGTGAEASYVFAGLQPTP
jgi:hypothetical protein